MQDLFHVWNNDFVLGAAGGLATTADSEQCSQKVIRRLLTSPGDDPFNLTYGAGLAAMIGTEVSASTIRGIVYQQMKLETGVDQSQPVSVDVTQRDDGAVFVNVKYVDALTGSSVELPVPLSN